MMNTGSQRLGKYELYERLGQGGMGDVWKAFDPQLRRFVAIKLLLADLQADPGFVARFKREAQLIASLHHPNIVQIYDFQFDASGGKSLDLAPGELVPTSHLISPPPLQSRPTAYMVMDYVEGQTLADYIYRTSHQGQFPPDTHVVNLFTSISLALDYAHHKGVVHRDIKPANILLDKRLISGKRNPMGEPILSDFGIARLQGPSTLVSSRLGLGTPLYISPEQAQGKPGNERSDLYSLGVILYEMLTGVPPFRGDNLVGILMQHYNTPPPLPESINPNISPALSAVMLRSLDKEPGARFPSACAMTIALAEALNVTAPVELTDKMSSMDPPEFQSSQEASSPTLSTPSSPGDQTTPMDPIGSDVAYSDGHDSPPPGWVSVKDSIQIPNTPPTSNEEQEPILVSSLAKPALPPTEGTSLLVTGDKRRRGLLIALVSFLVLLVIGSGLGTFLLLAQKSSSPPITVSPVVGHVFFASSGPTGQNSSQGVVDTLAIDLKNIPSPPAGKSYYAWLLGDTNDSEAQPIFLGKMPVEHGLIHFSFAGDQQHDDLIAITSRFLITAEDSAITPIVPTTDLSARLYYATIPQIPATIDHFSLLDHLRHLLAEDPKLRSQGLHGGLDIWLLKNTRQIAQWANDARQTHTTVRIRQDLVDILYYLDGQACVKSDLQDAPQGTPTTPENAATLAVAHIALLELCGQLSIPGYLVHIATHVNGLIHAPGSTAYQHKMANEITQELNDLNLLLEKVHQDARQLVKMSNAQLLQPSAQVLFNDLAIQANDAYDDQTNLSAHAGALQLHDDIERLATLDVMSCPPSGTACA